jgi:hypothetical protein
MRITCEHCYTIMDLEHTDTCMVCKNSHFLEPSKDQIQSRCIQEIRIKGDASAMILDGFDGCLIGTDNQMRLVYDIDLIRTALISNLGLGIVEADELLQTLIEMQENETLPPVFVSLNHELLNHQYKK